MLGLPVLDVAIGLVFIYLLLSLVVTAVSELLASWLKRRPATLWRGVVALLGDEMAAKALYGHPLIKGLTGTGWFEKYREGVPFQKRPSYIPSRTFALALLDSVSPVIGAGGSSAEHLRSALMLRLSANGDDALARSVSVLLEDAGGNMDRLKQNLETWFNNAMDRVTGWYKRRTQYILVGLSFAVTIWMNVDTVVMAKALSMDASTRSALVTQAQNTLEKGTPTAQESIAILGGISLPMGWETETGNWKDIFARHFFGWLLTSLAISMGAPFWFDMLAKVVSIRSAGKPPVPKQAIDKLPSN